MLYNLDVVSSSKVFSKLNFVFLLNVFLVLIKDQNIGKLGYIGNWILWIYRKYR